MDGEIYTYEEVRYLIAVMRLVMDRFARSDHLSKDAQDCWDSFCKYGEVSEIRTALAKYDIEPVLKPKTKIQ